MAAHESLGSNLVEANPEEHMVNTRNGKLGGQFQ